MVGFVRVTFAAALVAVLGPGCDTGAVETVDAGADRGGSSGASTGSSSGSSSGSVSTGSSSGSSSSGTTSSSASTTTSSSGSNDAGPGQLGADCTTTPCASPYVCCPAVNQCTHADMVECSTGAWVACTRQSDCTGGQVCCVGTFTSLPWSGIPSPSYCRPACLPQDLGFACNVADPNGGVFDCPQGAIACYQLANTPASLGLCVLPLPDGGAAKDASGDAFDAAGSSDN
jgi:hypothetical protein